jgi:hypothetical protein
MQATWELTVQARRATHNQEKRMWVWLVVVCVQVIDRRAYNVVTSDMKDLKKVVD